MLTSMYTTMGPHRADSGSDEPQGSCSAGCWRAAAAAEADYTYNVSDPVYTKSPSSSNN